MLSNVLNIVTDGTDKYNAVAPMPIANFDFTGALNSINNYQADSSCLYAGAFGLKRKEREYSDDSDQEEEVSPRLAKLLANEDNLPPHKLKAEIRKQKNRDAAAMSRKRNRDKMQRLEQEVQMLMQRNMELEQCISDIMKSQLLEPLPFYSPSDCGVVHGLDGSVEEQAESTGQAKTAEDLEAISEPENAESESETKTTTTEEQVDAEPLDFGEASTGYLESLLSGNECELMLQPELFGC